MVKITVKGRNRAWVKPTIYSILSSISLCFIFIYAFCESCGVWGTILMSIASSLIGAVVLAVSLDLAQQNTNKKLLSAALFEFNNELLKGIKEIAERLEELFPQKFYVKSMTCDRFILEIKNSMRDIRALFYGGDKNDVVDRIKKDSNYLRSIRNELSTFVIENKGIANNFATNGLCSERICFTLQGAMKSFVLKMLDSPAQKACDEGDFIEFCKALVELRRMDALKILGIDKFRLEKA